MSPTKTTVALLSCVAVLMGLPRYGTAQDDPPAKTPSPQNRRSDDLPHDSELRRGAISRFDSAPPAAAPSPPSRRRATGAPAQPDLRWPLPGPRGPAPNAPQHPGQPPMGQPSRLGSLFGGSAAGALEQLKRYDPEMYKLEVADRDLERKTLEASQMYRVARPDQRGEIKAFLRKQIEEHFDVRQSRRELHLKRLQEELEQLKQAIEGRVKKREEIISRRVSELLGESDLEF